MIDKIPNAVRMETLKDMKTKKYYGCIFDTRTNHIICISRPLDDEAEATRRMSSLLKCWPKSR